MKHSRIAHPANMLAPEQMAFNQPGCLLLKCCALKTPTDLYNLAMSQVSCKESTTLTMVIKTAFIKLDCHDFLQRT